MAGMDWFRWHHGSVTDPKFQLVARKSGASLPDVLAVWAYVLETASQAAKRGHFGEIDAEALDCLFNFPINETRTADILAAMTARGLITDGAMVAWEKRQPKREREDDNSTERVKAFREKQHHETPEEATKRLEERRLEEIRKEEGGGIPRATSADASEGMKSTGLQGVDPSHPKLSALLAIGITTAELVAASIDAVHKKKPFTYALATAEGRRRDSAIEPLPAAAKADPDSRSVIEAEGVAAGLGPWNETEQWAIYKARVRGNPQPILSLVALAGMAAQHQGATA